MPALALAIDTDDGGATDQLMAESRSDWTGINVQLVAESTLRWAGICKLQKKIARIGVHYRKNTKYVNKCKFRLIWPRIPLRADQSFRM